MKRLLALFLLCAAPCWAQLNVSFPGPGPIQVAAGAAVPTLVQSTQTPSDVQAQDGISQNPQTGNLITKPFPNSTQVGNTVVCHVRTSEATIGDIAISDDGSNTYTLRADEIAGSRTNAVFTAPITTTSRIVTVTYNDSAGDQTDNLVDCYEYENVGAYDVNCTGTATSLSAPACGSSMTPSSGDLIIAFVDVVSYSSKPATSANFTAQTGTTPTYSLLHNDGTSWSAAQYGVLASSTAITPSITLAQATTRANIAAVAMKAASSGGTFSGIHVNKVKAFAPQFANSTSFTGTTIALGFPCSGNSEWVFVGQGASSSTSNLTSVTDSNSNTWTRLTNLYSSGDGFAVQAAHVDSATCSATQVITLHFTSNPSFLTVYAVDIANATGYDSSATCTGGTPCLINNASSSATTTFSGAAITPSVSPGLILSYQNQDYQSIASATGNWNDGIESCPNETGGCSGNGIGTYSHYAYVGSGFEQDAGFTVQYYSSTAAITPVYTIAQTQGSTNSGQIGPAFNYTVAVKQ